MIRFFAPQVLAVACVALWPLRVLAAPSAPVKAARWDKIQLREDSSQRADEGYRRGDVWIKTTRGTWQRLTTHKRAAQPQLSPDKRIAIWMVGKSHPFSNGSTYFAPDHLAILANNATRVLRGEKYFVEEFDFHSGGKQIALLSRQSHGPSVKELFDLKTLKRVARFAGQTNDAKAPAWAKALGD